MSKWVKATFSKRIRENRITRKHVSCPIESFDFSSFDNDMKFYDTAEIKVLASS